MVVRFICLLFASLALSSCTSLLMPYSSDLGARRGYNKGYIGTINQVYKRSLYDEKFNKEGF